MKKIWNYQALRYWDSQRYWELFEISFFFFCDRITMEYLTKQSSKHEGKPWELKTLSWNQWNDQRALKIVKKYYKNKKCSNIRCFFITMRGF